MWHFNASCILNIFTCPNLQFTFLYNLCNLLSINQDWGDVHRLMYYSNSINNVGFKTCNKIQEVYFTCMGPIFIHEKSISSTNKLNYIYKFIIVMSNAL